MIRMTIALLATLVLLVITPETPTLAQQGDNGDCPILVEAALDAADAACTGIGRNEACYGNVVIDAQTRLVNNAPVPFDNQGDIALVSNIQSMELGAMNVARNEWGVALMRVQANLPDTLPGQNVTFLLFSDVAIEDVGFGADSENAALPTLLDVVTNENTNIRNGPGTEFSIIDSVPVNTTLVANGRNEASDWLRIEIPGTNRTGWIFAPLLNGSDSADTLNVYAAGDEDGETQFGPMQAFFFRSGIGDAPCTAAPDSGMLIQTPQGLVTVDLQINGVDVQLGSTVYITAGPTSDNNNNNALNVHLIEGSARIESNGVAQYLQPGQRLFVPLNDDFSPNSQPSTPQPYDGRDASLPIRLLENPTIIIPSPFTANPNAPVIQAINTVARDDDTFREDIVFTDANGDAETLNISLIDSSNPNIAFRLEGSSIDIPIEEQQNGAVLSRETLCTPGTEGVEVLLRVVITDSEGLQSNVVEYRLTCNE